MQIKDGGNMWEVFALLSHLCKSKTSLKLFKKYYPQLQETWFILYLVWMFSPLKLCKATKFQCSLYSAKWPFWHMLTYVSFSRNWLQNVPHWFPPVKVRRCQDQPFFNHSPHLPCEVALQYIQIYWGDEDGAKLGRSHLPTRYIPLSISYPG